MPNMCTSWQASSAANKSVKMGSSHVRSLAGVVPLYLLDAAHWLCSIRLNDEDPGDKAFHPSSERIHFILTSRRHWGLFDYTIETLGTKHSPWVFIWYHNHGRSKRKHLFSACQRLVGGPQAVLWIKSQRNRSTNHRGPHEEVQVDSGRMEEIRSAGLQSRLHTQPGR